MDGKSAVGRVMRDRPVPEAEGEFVLLGFPDINGSIRGKALRPSAFRSACEEGTVITDLLLALDPEDVPIADFERIGTRSGAADLILRPEPGTLGDLTWCPGWSLCLATPFWPDGSTCELASREVLRRSLGQLSALGFEAIAALEFEVRVFHADGQPLSGGISYSMSELSVFDELARGLGPALAGLGIELTAVHTEAGPGLLELNVAARPAMRAADDAVMLKFAVKEVARKLGLRASFLAKTTAGEEGSSGHVHFSFWQDGLNTFAQFSPLGQPSATLSAALAGTLDHLAGASLLLNPTINSYKRLVPGFFAPVNATWGIDNRSAALRVIRSELPARCRIECRRPGADVNPYLALAAITVAACDGITRQSVPPAPTDGDASQLAGLPGLPASLEAALAAFESDTVLRAGLGQAFSEYYATSRAWELRAWQNIVSDWERNRYERAV
ncbi:MAG TPA: glutamine synthetase family protein [Acidimicrobiales bacterium]|nr:glutamine synthetase family protein [Acidimicrobiales bacterium]